MNDRVDPPFPPSRHRTFKESAVTAGERESSSGEDKVDLVALWRVMWKYKYLIGACTLLFGLVAVFMALTAIPVYRAEVSVTEVSTPALSAAGQLANQLGGIANLVGVNLGAGSAPTRESQGLLKSRRLVEEFVKRHNQMPELFAHSKVRPTLWLTVRKFKDDVLSIRDDKRSGLTIVGINWTDPVVAARWGNEFVALANELMRTRAMNESKASIAYLERQIDQTNVVELKRVLYDLVENETKTLVLANARMEYAFTVVDPAVAPEQRFSPRRTLMTLLGLALGGIAGTLAALAHNSWSERRRQTS